jgi:lipoprotein-releasing system permease protein
VNVKSDRRTGSTSGGGRLALDIAARYLRSTRRDAFVSFLAAAACCGIAVGVAALILALAALSGFQGALRDEILARTPEIEITLPGGADVAGLEKAIEATVPGVEAQRLLQGRGWLIARGSATPVRLIAFDEALPQLFPGVEARPQGLYVGSALAQRWRLEIGMTVEVASAQPTLSPLGPQPRVRRLPVAGIFTTGPTESEDRVALPWAVGESLIGRRAANILVSSGDLARVDAIVRRIEPLLPPASTLRTWRDLNRALLFALRLEKSLMFLGVFLIVVVAVLALVSGLMLILSSKRREIGMLQAMGAPPGTVRRIFLWLAAILAGAGAAAGLVLGSGLAWVLDHWQLLALPDQVYFLDYVPFRLRASDAAFVLAASLGLVLICASWAAGRAARLRPVEALRR